MLKQTGELSNFADCRWRVLLFMVLLLIAGSMLKRHGNKATGSNAPESTKSWREMDLRWEPEGRFGQGVYSNRHGEVCLSATMLAGEGAEEKSLAEPRLAVFTFRPIDLNLVDFDTLRVLKGVGPKMAAAIIDYRRNHGSFRRIDELLEVKGIGPAKFKVLCQSLAVDTSGDS